MAGACSLAASMLIYSVAGEIASSDSYMLVVCPNVVAVDDNRLTLHLGYMKEGRVRWKR